MVRNCGSRWEIWILPKNLRGSITNRYGSYFSIIAVRFNANYVTVKATALYSYTGDNSDELPFVEGDSLSIVDRSDSDWWKAEQGGVIFIVPAAYLEVVEG